MTRSSLQGASKLLDAIQCTRARIRDIINLVIRRYKETLGPSPIAPAMVHRLGLPQADAMASMPSLILGSEALAVMLTIVEWCRTRLSIAAVSTMSSAKALSQVPKERFEVRIHRDAFIASFDNLEG